MKDGDMSLFGSGVIVGLMVMGAIWFSYSLGKNDGVKMGTSIVAEVAKAVKESEGAKE